MEIVLFWVLWTAISFWALKTFYFSFSKDKLELLQRSALGLNLAVFVLTLLPWLPLESGGYSAFMLGLKHNPLAILFIILLFVSIVLLLSRKVYFIKLASLATILNSVVIFILMLHLRPQTFILTWWDIVPIIATLFLLIADIVVLLLWQQLDKMKRYSHQKGFALIPVLIVAGIVILGIIYYFQKTPLQEIIPSQLIPGTTGVTKNQAVVNVNKLPEVQEYLKNVPNGKVEVDNESEGQYSVHVYEVKNGHTATFNWYRVSIKSGQVRPEFSTE